MLDGESGALTRRGPSPSGFPMVVDVGFAVRNRKTDPDIGATPQRCKNVAMV
jgi:hypothetical protein